MKTPDIFRSLRVIFFCAASLRILAGETLLDEAVRAEIARAHEERLAELFSEYRKQLDERFRAPETQGDIELMVLIADERDDPGSGPPPIELLGERDHLQWGRLRAERTRQRDILNRLVARLAEADVHEIPQLQSAIETMETKIAGPLLGECILPADAFSPAQRLEWRILIPRGRSMNRTGLEAAEGEQTAPVLRIHQDERQPLLINRDLPLLQGADYELTWQARLDLERTGGDSVPVAGAYSIGFGVSDRRFQSLPAEEKANLIRTVLEIAPAPQHGEWQEQRGVLRAGRHMNQLILRISSGEGEWKIRNLEIRRIHREE